MEDFLYRLEEYVAFRNASFRVTGRLLQVTQLTLQATPVTGGSGSPPLAVTIGLNAYLWGGVSQLRGWRCTMSPNRRVLTYVAIALIVGAALASPSPCRTAARATSGAAAAGGDKAAVTAYSAGSDAAALAAADPAKEQPLLDKFTSKDPFIPFPTPGAATTHSDAEPDQHVGSREALGEGQGRRDDVQRHERRQGARRFGRRVHHHRRDVRRRDVQGHRRHTQER